jgi:CO/xanthine dehydrogenase Mo-binding subunit
MSHVVGTSCIRVDSTAKVSGQACYIDDLRLPGMLYGKVLRSTHAHAKIKAVRSEKARQLPGVRAVVAGRDFPYLHGECIINIPFLAIEKVRYIGEPVAAVAAEDPAIAEQALDLVEIEYELLPAVFDPEKALQPEAPLIHEELGTYKTISAVHLLPGTNVCEHSTFSLGNIERGFRESDYVFEDRFTTPQVQHAAIEPHGCIAQVDAAGRITVWGQNDSPHRARKEIAQALGLAQSRVRVITGYVGGNFGGKGGLKPEAVAIALAHQVRGRPVKVVFSREEVFNTLTRLGCVIDMKTGVRGDGILLARKVRLIWDLGAYAEKGPTISMVGSSLSAGPYGIEHVQIESFSVFTNKPMAGAMRGYGLPQVAFAHEAQMDIIAERLGMDSLKLRTKNAVVEGSKVPTGQTLCSVAMKECLEWVGKGLYSEEETPSPPRCAMPSRGRWVKGKGLACAYKAVKTPTVSAAFVKIDEDASASIVTSTVEVGQGSHTILMQIASSILGIEEDRITVSFADTDVTPYDTSTTASRSTFHMGNAVRFAAEDARRQLIELAAPLLNADQCNLHLHKGNVVAPDGRWLPIAQVLKATFGAGAGAAVLGQGVYTPQDILGIEALDSSSLEAYSMLSVFHSYAAQGAEVMVDLDTGDVRVLRLIAAHDVGKAINPNNCRQQVEGAMAMGLGYGLMEECIWKGGKMLNPDFHNYKIPSTLDCPPVKVCLVEKPHPQGPFGAKGIGEMALAPTAPAIANAVYHACGVRIHDLPLKPAKILAELRRTRGARIEV